MARAQGVNVDVMHQADLKRCMRWKIDRSAYQQGGQDDKRTARVNSAAQVVNMSQPVDDVR